MYIGKRKGGGGGRTFQANGAKLWNSIPLDIRKKDSIGSFKTSLKKYRQELLGQFLDVHVMISIKNYYNH